MAKSTAVVAKKNIKSPTLASAPLHPPYFEMINEAISVLKERNGSSQQAIVKFINEKHNRVLPSNFKKLMSVQLKKFVKSERLVKVKNSFKISSAEKNKKKEKDPKAIVLKSKSKLVEKISVSNESKKKRLNQVKTPGSVMKSGNGGAKAVKKTKRLSQVKTPEVLKRKTGKPIDSSSKASKRARK